jgi:uncharacterized protein
MQRRKFLQILAGAAAAAPLSSQRAESTPSDELGPLLPLRPLGNSGIKVTCLGLGGFHIGWTTESLAQATIEAALEEGVRFFDTAESYGPHTSEERYGRYLTPRYRDQIFLMTKSTAKDGVTARQHIEASLRRLATDHVDLWQIHSLSSPHDVDERLQAGVLEAAIKARDEGKIRHIGFTGHASPAALLRMLEQTGHTGSPFLTSQFPVNPVDAGATPSFIGEVLPKITNSNLAPLAMKTLADGRFFARKDQGGKTTWTSSDPIVPNVLSVADCIHFALSQPVAVLITGAENPKFLREKAALTRAFSKMSSPEKQAIIERVASYSAAGKVEYYKSG